MITIILGLTFCFAIIMFINTVMNIKGISLLYSIADKLEEMIESWSKQGIYIDISHGGKYEENSEVEELIPLADEICNNYCKWHELYGETDELYKHCDECPITLKL